MNSILEYNADKTNLNLIGVYGRLSKDEKGEKLASLETQRDYIIQYINDNRLGVIVDFYLDDDTRGVYFEREQLDRLKEDIASQRVNTIVVKDFSRLGRYQAKFLQLLDDFELAGVHVIAIDDNFDSQKDDGSYVGIKAWYNELFVRDISKKQRSNIHQKLRKGEYLGTAPFGFNKERFVQNNKLITINKLVVDETIRQIIIEIFDLYIKGYGYRAIADMMQAKGYPNPSQYKNYNRPQSMRWTKDHIKRIVTNPVYCGDTHQGKAERISFKTNKTRKRPKEKWYVTKDTHEPIVSREIWELANQINQKRAEEKGTRNKKTIHLFSGFLQCGACGKFLCARKTSNKPLGFICSTYFHFGKKNGCDSHHVRHEHLEQIVVEDIFRQKGDTSTESVLNKFFSQSVKEKDFSKIIINHRKEIEKLDQQLGIIYEDRLNGVITVDFYVQKTKDIQSKIEYLKTQITSLEEKMNNEKSKNLAKQNLLKILDEFKGKELTREFLERAIEKIYVFLPGDIKDENKDTIVEKLDADLDTINRLQSEGGIFIKYNY